MARGKTQEAPRRNPPTLTVSRTDAQQQIADRIAKGSQLNSRPIKTREELDDAERLMQIWSSYNTELLQRIFDNDVIVSEYNWYPLAGSVRMYESLVEDIHDFHTFLSGRITKLEAILERLPLIPEPALHIPAATAPGIAFSPGGHRSVFVVHGHDTAARETLARFLGQIGLTPIILHEQPTAGRTLLEKFEAHADVDFAVVLLTPDDVFTMGSATFQRSRQNVIFELGFFFGKLGRQKVAVIFSGDVELPSDVHGLTYIPLDPAGAWKNALARELRAAGFTVDLNRI
jgi:predicted nucleotide-binding protein